MIKVEGSQILVVEDEPDGQEVIANLLRKVDIQMEGVGTAEEAIERLSENNYAAVIIDLALPGMDGLQLIQAIRQNPDTADLLCVAITAYHSSKVRKEAMEAGFNGYFPKPLGGATFTSEFSQMLGAS